MMDYPKDAKTAMCPRCNQVVKLVPIILTPGARCLDYHKRPNVGWCC